MFLELLFWVICITILFTDFYVYKNQACLLILLLFKNYFSILLSNKEKKNQDFKSILEKIAKQKQRKLVVNKNDHQNNVSEMNLSQAISAFRLI